MNSIKVTPENLIAKAAQVDSKASEYYNEYRGLLGDVQELTGTDWTGEDANAFREKVEGFEPDFNKMKELMNEYASFLREAAKNYTNTKENVKATIKSLR